MNAIQDGDQKGTKYLHVQQKYTKCKACNVRLLK